MLGAGNVKNRLLAAGELEISASVHWGLTLLGRCDVDGSPEALQLGLRQHLSQFDHARHVFAVTSGQVVAVEAAERRRDDRSEEVFKGV